MSDHFTSQFIVFYILTGALFSFLVFEYTTIKNMRFESPNAKLLVFVIVTLGFLPILITSLLKAILHAYRETKKNNKKTE